MADRETRQPDTPVLAQAPHRGGRRHRPDRRGNADPKQHRRRFTVGPLLDQLGSPVGSFTADGAFDRDDVYTEVTTRHPDAEVIVPPRSGAVPSQTAGTTPTQRDRHIEVIAEHGRMAWQKASGYNWRALVEADISRWKRVIGDRLRSQTDGRQASEVAIAVSVLNRMLELGRPEYVRIV